MGWMAGLMAGILPLKTDYWNFFATRMAGFLASSQIAQGNPLHRRLQPLRHLHDCSDCYRLERPLPGGSDPRWKTVPLHGALNQ